MMHGQRNIKYCNKYCTVIVICKIVLLTVNDKIIRTFLYGFNFC
jgi:hypothetical protein